MNSWFLIRPVRAAAGGLALLLGLCALRGAPGIAQAAPMKAEGGSAVPDSALPRPDGQHDFDFEPGRWKAHLKRLLHPLTGSTEWVELEGTSVVRKIWDGRANLGELEVGDATTHVEGLTLRLYNPQTRQWSIFWSNSADGTLGTPMIGGFRNGRGEFYDQELFQGRAVFVRFIFSDLAATSFKFEQAFSADGGKSWETNWIATFELLKP